MPKKSLDLTNINNINAIVLLIFSTITALYWATDFGRSNIWLKYVSVLSSIGITISVLSFLIQRQNDIEDRKEKAKNDFLAVTQTKWTDLEKYISSKGDALLPLYMTVYPDNPLLKDYSLPTLDQNGAPTGENVADRRKRISEEVHALFIILQNCEDIFIAFGSERLNNINKENTEPDQDITDWLFVIRKWLHTPKIKSYWPYWKKYYNVGFVKYVDENIYRNGSK
ncbi:MAG: hypothetical protein H0U27_00905 [Nitrosopumilus sp.]|nr:hypothetical protein [Nitrosopumilus sp.]